jgi:hypothetical protein
MNFFLVLTLIPELPRVCRRPFVYDLHKGGLSVTREKSSIVSAFDALLMLFPGVSDH